MAQINHKVKDIIAAVTFVLFMLAAAFYFLTMNRTANPDDFNVSFLYYAYTYRIAIPAIILTLAGLFILPWQMVFAFVFCVVGDIMGAADNFFGQMAFYIVVQVAFSAMFAHLIWPKTMIFGKEVRQIKIQDSIPWPYLVLAVLCIMFVLFVILPVTVGPTMKFGVAIYAFMLIQMTLLSIGLTNKYKFPYAMMGGVLFFFSDLILGCQKFLFPHFDARWYVMVTYYLAILLLGYSVYRLNDRTEQ